MPPEIEQPSHLDRPNLADPITWSSIASLHCDWLRAVAPQLGLDTTKLILGDALTSIIGDDANCFGLQAVYNPEYTEDAKTFLFIRMDWESELSELPEDIRNRIRAVRQQLAESDWNGSENFGKVREIWINKIRNFTKHQIALNADLQDAIKYDDTVAYLWTPYWNEFLYGNTTGQ